MCTINTTQDIPTYLQCVLDSYSMSHIEEEVKTYRAKRDTIQKHLEQEFSGKLAGNIILSGSIAKSTSINTKYDLDLIVPFKRFAFGTLKEMMDDLKAKLEAYQKKDSSVATVRQQTFSVGVTFLNNSTASMDIVPGRELSQDSYANDKYLNLYNYDKDTYTQTNISLQLDAIRNSHDNVRSIIKLLKIWKKQDASRKYIKSFLLELLAIRTFNDKGKDMPDGLWPQLRTTIEFIRDNITTISLKDPGNSNNVVSDLLTDFQKTQMSNEFKNMLNSINTYAPNIKTYFPDNVRYCK